MQPTPPPAAAGIDISVDAVHVALSPLPGSPVTVIDLTDHNWHHELAALIPAGSTVAYEPTGWHYSAPIVSVLQHHGCDVLQVEHRITGMIRTLRISGVKKDMTDAQALCYIAAQNHLTPLRGVHPAAPRINEAVTALRMLVWAQLRATKETTRTRNRLRQLAHSVWPSLDQRLVIYLRAIQNGYITPTNLRQLAASIQAGDVPAPWKHATRRRELLDMIATLPDWLEADHLRAPIDQEAAALRDQAERAATLEALITDMVQDDPFADLTDLWLTVPGAGPLALAAIHVATHGAAASLHPNQFVAALGSHPHTAQSGETTASSATRQGFKPAKRAIYLWTMLLIREGNNKVATTFQARKTAGKDHAIQAARQKLCDILSGIARTGSPYDPEKGKPK